MGWPIHNNLVSFIVCVEASSLNAFKNRLHDWHDHVDMYKSSQQTPDMVKTGRKGRHTAIDIVEFYKLLGCSGRSYFEKAASLSLD